MPAALTKDKKRIRGQEIAVHLAWRSTLYITNFPEDADDTFIRTLFGKVSTDLAMSVEDRGSLWLTVRRDLRRAVAEQEVQEHTALLLRAVHNSGTWT